MNKRVLILGIAMSSVLAAGCSSDDDDDMTVPVATPGVGNSVYDNIVNDPDLSTLRTAIDAAGLADTLDNEAMAYTVFAPNNAAFQALEDSNPDDDLIGTLLADPDQLAPILTYHVLSGTTDATAAAAAAPASLTTVNGAEVALDTATASPTGLSIGGANILIADSGYDAATSVGIVHVIDAVLLPPAEDAEQPPTATPGIGNSAYDAIVNDAELSTLRAAIDAAGLADTLDDESAAFTVFAPDNAAFQALEDSDPSDDLLTALLADPAQLAPILTYHVVPSIIDSTAAAAAVGSAVTTVNGAAVDVTASSTSAVGIAVGGADVSRVDVGYTMGTSTGIVHVIQSVLLPPTE